MPFFLLKGLSFLPFGGIFKNPKVIIGLILVAVVAFGIWKWKASIKEAIYNQIYTEQAEQHIENQQREMERRQQLMDESNRAVRQAQEERARLLREIEQARALTRNVDPARNGEVAPVLSDALEFIRSRGAPTAPRERTWGERLDDITGADRAPERDTEEPAEASPQGLTGNPSIDAWRAKQREK